MKRTLLLFTFLQLFFSCNKPSETGYFQKLEYGLKGKVKEVTYYACRVKDDKIPADTADYTIKSTTAFDEMGNIITIDRLYNFNVDVPGSIKETKIAFSGKGKDLSQIDKVHFDDGTVKESRSKFVWSDKYNYSIIPQDSSEHSTFVTLDKNYVLKKTVFKNKEAIEPTEEYETLYKDDKISEIIKKITEMVGGKADTYYQIQVMKEFDSSGNPTVIYVYSDVSKQTMTNVIYKKYKYY